MIMYKKILFCLINLKIFKYDLFLKQKYLVKHFFPTSKLQLIAITIFISSQAIYFIYFNTTLC